MFNLSAQIASKPIMDEPYKRHLRTADVFNEVQDAREAAFDALIEADKAMGRHDAAVKRYEAAKAKAALMESMEDL